MIGKHKFDEGEKLNIVAHSHGGNVVKEYSQMEGARKIDNAVSLGVPQREDYKMNLGNVDNYLNVYSDQDMIQQWGGGQNKIYDNHIDKNVLGEYGRLNSRKDPSATNINASYLETRSGGRTSTTGVGHSRLHTNRVWDEYVRPSLEAP